MSGSKQIIMGPVELVNTYSAELSDELVDRVQLAVKEDGKEWISPSFYLFFEVGMHVLRYQTPEEFSRSCDYSAGPNDENSAEKALADLVLQYDNKFLRLERTYERGFDPGSEDLVRIDKGLLDHARGVFARYESKPAELIAHPEYGAEEKRAFCDDVVRGLYHEVLPEIEIAGASFMAAGRYVLDKVSELGGSSVTVKSLGEFRFNSGADSNGVQ